MHHRRHGSIRLLCSPRGLDHAIQAAFAHGLDVTLLAAGGAGLVAALIIGVTLRPRGTVELEALIAHAP
ncbi:MAG TPA: hypothetical protein VJU79_02070 [Candidatus Dormibacteraeota bacterium]|nr:hypothetical protein [Candidatus Dormibacteraeota bacterium]